MSTPAGFTLDQHQQTGAELLQINERLQAIRELAITAYGKGSTPDKKVAYVLAALGRLRSELRTQLFAEAGETKPNPRLAKVYWPPLRQAGAPAGSGGAQ